MRSVLTLAEVIETHLKYAHYNELNLNLCDGYLFHTHQMFRNTRECAKQIGTQFTTKDNFHYERYWAFSLAKVVENKEVPYQDNSTRLIEIETSRPKRLDFLELLPIRNYVFHEANHIIFDHLLDHSLFHKMKMKDTERKQVLRIHMQEAYAVAQDTVGALYCSNHFSREIYKFTTNFSYENAQKYVLPVFDLVDHSGALKMAMFLFLSKALLIQNLDRGSISRIASILFGDRKFSQKDISKFANLYKFAESLSYDANVSVSNAFFRVMFEKNRDIFDLSDFDFIHVLEKEPDLIEALHKLTEISESGLNSSFFLNSKKPQSISPLKKSG